MANTINNGPWTVTGAPVFAAGVTTITVNAVLNISIGLPGRLTKGIVSTYHVGSPGTTVPLGNGQATTETTIPITITAASVGGSSFTVAGDFANLFTTPWTSVAISGSSGNDGKYGITSATFGGSNTVIVVSPAPASGTGGGTISVIDEFGNDSGPSGNPGGTGLTINVTGIT